MKNITTRIQRSILTEKDPPSDPARASAPSIHFGTDGWRGRIAEEITLQGMRRCAAGIAKFLNRRKQRGSPVVIGYDGRFLSDRFSLETARYLRRRGFLPILSPHPLPTPALSHRVVTARASMGIMITASHNPPEYSGLKLKDATGGTLDPEQTRALERMIPSLDPGSRDEPPFPRHPSFIPSYLRNLKRQVAIKRIRGARLSLQVDSMHGMGGNLLEEMLRGGRASVQTLRSNMDPLFGGGQPEPTSGNLHELSSTVRKGGADLGIATDGDADRFAACDEKGRFLSPLTLLPLLAIHLIEVRGLRGGIAKTFAGSMRMQRIARRHGLPFYDLPIGFKHVAQLLREDAILLGGEESGGFGFQGYLPERDGLLSALMLLEALVFSGTSLSGLVTRMEKEYGRLAYNRIDLPCSPERGRRIVAQLEHRPPRRIAGMKVTGVDRLDGLKLLFGEEGWILFRPSGTEPVLRLYCEAPSRKAVAGALRQAAKLARP